VREKRRLSPGVGAAERGLDRRRRAGVVRRAQSDSLRRSVRVPIGPWRDEVLAPARARLLPVISCSTSSHRRRTPCGSGSCSDFLAPSGCHSGKHLGAGVLQILRRCARIVSALRLQAVHSVASTSLADSSNSAAEVGAVSELSGLKLFRYRS